MSKFLYHFFWLLAHFGFTSLFLFLLATLLFATKKNTDAGAYHLQWNILHL